MTNAKTNYADIWLENGIIHVVNTQTHYTEEMVDQIIQERNEVRNGKEYPLLSYMQNFKSATKKARERLLQEDANEGITAMAVLSSSRLHIVYFNFMTTFYKMRLPVKMFTDKEKAITWLTKYN